MPARIPVAALRRSTRKKRDSGRCPRVAARSPSAGSTVANAERAAITRNGADTKDWAITTPGSDSVNRPPKNCPMGV
jgi:hypothetical protein